jgi:Radical SAM superfamily
MKKVALINLPVYEVHRPPAALAVLTSICVANNCETKCYDINLRLYQTLNKEDWFKLITWLEYDTVDFKDEFISVINSLPELNELLTFDLIAVSIFSYTTKKAAEEFCKILRSKGYTNDIVFGGQGLDSVEWNKYVIENNICNDFILGEAEVTFSEYLKGNKNLKGINTSDFDQLTDIETFYPDYSYLPLNEYPYTHGKELYITGSRGCVRKCTYCNVPFLWKKFRQRSGRHIANEMIQQYRQHGVTRFWFTDSLVNGSVKAFMELCDCLIEFYAQEGIDPFIWKGQFIFRPHNQINEDYFRKISQAGGREFYVGLETGSDRVRWEMDKKFTTDDAEYHLEMFKKYGISCLLLMITGYVNETEQDHRDTFNLFKRWQKFVASGTIAGVELGSTLGIFPNTPLYHLVETKSITLNNDDPWSWEDNNSNLKLRIKRRIELQLEAEKYLWPITNNEYRTKFFLTKLEKQLTNK